MPLQQEQYSDYTEHDDSNNVIDDTTYNGLGYNHYNSNNKDTPPPPPPPTTTNHFVQALLQECLTYHEEQEGIRQQHPLPPPPIVVQLPQPPLPQSIVPSIPYVSSIPNGITDQPCSSVPLSATTLTAGIGTIVLPLTNQPTNSEDEQQIMLAQQARQRAQVILDRFHNNSKTTNSNNNNNTIDTTTIVPTETSIGTIQTQPPVVSENVINYVQQREIGFQREEQRLRIAMIKNLQYIVHKQNQQLQLLNTNITQTQQYESIIQQQYYSDCHNSKYHVDKSNINGKNNTTWVDQSNLPLIQQLQKSYTATNNIKNGQNVHMNQVNSNTCDPTPFPVSQNKRHVDDINDEYVTSTRSTFVSSTSTVAIYIYTVPAITSSSSLYWKESYIEQLFTPYGSIRNVYLYRTQNNSSKQQPPQTNGSNTDNDKYYKGDGIIIYKMNSNNKDSKEVVTANAISMQQQEEALIKLVCGQMNGAELPCGTILRVEAATSNDKKHTTIGQQKDSVDTAAGNHVTESNENGNILQASRMSDVDANIKVTAIVENEQDSDLEDFFESL